MTTTPVIFAHGHSLQAGESLAPAARGASLFMLAIVVLVLAALAVGIITIIRRARRGESPEHTLLRELRDEEKNPGRGARNPPPSGEKPAPESWEKDPDWWKNDSSGGRRADRPGD